MLTFEEAEKRISSAFGPISSIEAPYSCPKCRGKLMRISVFRGSPHFKVKVLQVWQVEHPEDWDFYYEICADCSHIPRIIDLGNNVSTNNHLVNFEGVQESQLDRPPKP